MHGGKWLQGVGETDRFGELIVLAEEPGRSRGSYSGEAGVFDGVKRGRDGGRPVK